MNCSACAFISLSSFSSLYMLAQFLKTTACMLFMEDPRFASSLLRASSFWFFIVEAMFSASFLSLNTSAQNVSHCFHMRAMRPWSLEAFMRSSTALASCFFESWNAFSLFFAASTSSLALWLFFTSLEILNQLWKQTLQRPEAWVSCMRSSTDFALFLCLAAILTMVALTSFSSLSQRAFFSSKTFLACSSSPCAPLFSSNMTFAFSMSSLAFLKAARSEL
mmetsp:Transcript_120229/g.335431  ORF Transcript_120229/g.335431 Transcript_120229/m.335431 type:complete len:221 (+) Transcript_120229:508-1170(+)